MSESTFLAISADTNLDPILAQLSLVLALLVFAIKLGKLRVLIEASKLLHVVDTCWLELFGLEWLAAKSIKSLAYLVEVKLGQFIRIGL